MAEETEQTETVNEETETVNTEADDKQETEDSISKANVAAERLEKANAETAKLLARQEKLKVKETLGGTASAGSPTVTQEQKEIKEAKKYLEGSGYEGMLDDAKKD